jgi:hypothetical protein
MWTVKDGRLFCGRDPVAIRRVVVEIVVGHASGAVSDDKVRCMIRMERALSLRDLSCGLAREGGGS